MGFTNTLLRPLRKIQFVADWVDFQSAKREALALSARHQEGLAAAKARDASRGEYDTINGQYAAESEIIWHPIYAQDSNKLTTQARRYGVRVPQLPNDYAGNDDWVFSQATGDYFLTNEGEERLKAAIRTERRQVNEEFRKWATLVLSVAALVLALLPLVGKERQPDPCPKNYYRSDSGECIFGLQEPPQPQQQATPPLPQPPEKSPPATSKPSD
jgi:hypothetical protein